MKKALNDLPDINRRVKKIIDTERNGNVRRFSLDMGLSDSSKINRLFNKDKRTDEYPLPSTDIVLLIKIVYGYSPNWILCGIGEEKINDVEKHVNNIDITRNEINGDNNNVVGNGNTNTNISSSPKTNDSTQLIDIIKIQQEQINKLISKF